MRRYGSAAPRSFRSRPWAGGLTAPPAPADAMPRVLENATTELRRLVASMHLLGREQSADQPAQLVPKQLAAIAGGAQTLEGIAKAGVTLAQQLTERGFAI